MATLDAKSTAFHFVNHFVNLPRICISWPFQSIDLPLVA